MTQTDNQYLNRVIFDRFLEAANRLTKKQRAIDESKVERFAALYFRTQGRAFVSAFQARHKPLSESRAEVDDIFAALVKTGDLTLEKIQALCEQHYLGGMTFADRSLNLGLSFDLKNPRAVAYFKEFKSRLKSDLDSTTKARIETIITQGLEEGTSYDVIARMIKQEFQSFAKPPKGGPKHIRTRAQLVAVTELGNAYAAGSIGMVRDAMDTGLQFEKSWLTSRDDRVSDGCRENAAIGWIDIDTPFPSGHDHPTRFPGCRCDLLLRRATDRVNADRLPQAAQTQPTPQKIITPEQEPIPETPATSTFTPRQFASAKDADKLLIKDSDVHAGDLDYFSQSALQNYQHEGYKVLNGALRSGNKKLIKENQREIDLIDKVIKRSHTHEDLLVHRGMYLNPGSPAEDLVNRWEVGGMFQEDGYMSTTVDQGRVNKFLKSISAKDKQKGSAQVFIDVEVPKGTPALYMNSAVEQRGITNYKEEKELLIQRGARYRVKKKVRDEKGNYYVTLEIVND